MSAFSQAEIAYLQSQRLGRLATVNTAGEPHVVPVAFRYNPELDTIDIGGRAIATTKKFRDAKHDDRVAFVVDDVQVQPWRARGIEVRGRAVVLPEGGTSVSPDFDAELIRIRPARIIAWGVETDPFQRNSRAVQ